MRKKVPEIVKQLCEGYEVKYQGEYQDNDVFSSVLSAARTRLISNRLVLASRPISSSHKMTMK